MRTDGRWYVDERGNRWSTSSTLELVQLWSRSLVNCTDCIDCRYCRNCVGCRGCNGCVDCTNCANCVGCMRCTYCATCESCTDCQDCRRVVGCERFEQNPCRYMGPEMGSRGTQTTVYWLGDRTQVICGCYTGTLEAFEERVSRVHGDNRHGREYRRLIATVRKIREMEATT